MTAAAGHGGEDSRHKEAFVLFSSTRPGGHLLVQASRRSLSRFFVLQCMSGWAPAIAGDRTQPTGHGCKCICRKGQNKNMASERECSAQQLQEACKASLGVGNKGHTPDPPQQDLPVFPCRWRSAMSWPAASARSLERPQCSFKLSKQIQAIRACALLPGPTVPRAAMCTVRCPQRAQCKSRLS